MNRVLRNILLVEDETAFASTLREIILAEGRATLAVSIATSLATAREQLTTATFDLILLDLTLPDQAGLATFTAIQQAAPGLPIIVLTGTNDEETALQALREGAQDYLVKSEFDGRIITRAIRYAVERHQIERRLRQSETFHRLITENISDLIAVLDTNGKRLYNSPSYEGVLRQPQDLAGTDSFGEIHPDDRDHIRAVFDEAVATGIGRRAEYRFLLPDGSIRHVESQSNVITPEAGSPGRVVVVSRDVSDRIKTETELRTTMAALQKSHEELKATQQQLIQSEKLEAVSTFAAGVAHEVKNPLQTVLLGIDYISDYALPDDENARSLLPQMREAVQKADAIIRALLEFSSYRKGVLAAHDLNEILRNSLRAVQPELANTQIDVSEDLADALPLLRLDPRSMRHVFTNLLTTEIQQLRGGGTLTIRSSARQLTEAEQTPLRATTPNLSHHRKVQVEIESQASKAAVMPAIKPKTPAEPARDFGLLVLKKVTELYGGKVEFSRNASGSRFLFTFTT